MTDVSWCAFGQLRVFYGGSCGPVQDQCVNMYNLKGIKMNEVLKQFLIKEAEYHEKVEKEKERLALEEGSVYICRICEERRKKDIDAEIPIDGCKECQ